MKVMRLYLYTDRFDQIWLTEEPHQLDDNPYYYEIPEDLASAYLVLMDRAEAQREVILNHIRDRHLQPHND